MDMGVIDQDCCSSGTITVQLFLIYFITKPWGMAREDKNKDGSPRRGSHQRNPAFIRGQKRKKSDYSLAGDWPSELQQQRSDHDGDGKTLHPGERRFNLVVDNVPYLVKAAPFTFNGEIRYRVRFNESSEHEKQITNFLCPFPAFAVDNCAARYIFKNLNQFINL